MKAVEVKPQKWFWDENYPIRILFDDNVYSVIWGKYENSKVMGVRWNGEDEIGFPSQGRNPIFHIEPDFIALSILQNLQLMYYNKNQFVDIDAVMYAITELTEKIKKERKP